MPMILRPGAVTKEQIEAVIESPVAIDQHLVKKMKHQSPWDEIQTLLTRYTCSDGQRWRLVNCSSMGKIRRSVQVS